MDLTTRVSMLVAEDGDEDDDNLFRYKQAIADAAFIGIGFIEAQNIWAEIRRHPLLTGAFGTMDVRQYRAFATFINYALQKMAFQDLTIQNDYLDVSTPATANFESNILWVSFSFLISRFFFLLSHLSPFFSFSTWDAVVLALAHVCGCVWLVNPT